MLSEKFRGWTEGPQSEKRKTGETFLMQSRFNMRYATLLVMIVALSASAGCAKYNLKNATSTVTETTKTTGDWITRTLGKGQASDPRARDIEQRLGYGEMLEYK